MAKQKDPLLKELAKDDLTDKQKMFVEHYLTCWNATQAAKRAGYEGNDVTLGAVGYENLRKPQIAKYVQKRMSEACMSADEVLSRLADHARGSMRPFLDQCGESVRVDISEEEPGDKPIHLIKKIRVKHTMRTTKDGEEIEEFDNSIELHDSQAALVHIGRHYVLFTDRTEHDFSKLSDAELLAAAAGDTALAQVAGSVTGDGAARLDAQDTTED